jgi:dihydrodipicolinate synthase/N-acetylneuraminate lyase
VPNPAITSPSEIYYRITVKDSTTGQEVLRCSQVSFTGATFDFDNYPPLNPGNFAALTGNGFTGNLSVTGNVAATGSVRLRSSLMRWL